MVVVVCVLGARGRTHVHVFCSNANDHGEAVPTFPIAVPTIPQQFGASQQKVGAMAVAHTVTDKPAYDHLMEFMDNRNSGTGRGKKKQGWESARERGRVSERGKRERRLGQGTGREGGSRRMSRARGFCEGGRTVLGRRRLGHTSPPRRLGRLHCRLGN